jgi:Fur family ferric uptake transcriptional regulator
MTRIRQLVLDRLTRAETPCSALGAARDLQADCDQATVYRALHWLEGHDYLESFVLHCHEHGTERYYLPRGLAHRHWFHCEACHVFIDLGVCTLEERIHHWEQTLGLSVRIHSLQVTGLCASCRAAGGPSALPADQARA